ncbi:MAG: TonB-dependent receptor plug domain-containing protein [Bacteroidaceae bacterium]|nr:TonB-dependent receptor plug domain-containing protein [Bacteroidaceae bacterium]
MKRLLIYILLCVGLSSVVQAQNSDEQRNIYNEAENAYNLGRLEYAEELLNSNINIFRGTMKQGAYRLLALSNLGMDDDEEAELFVSQLLRENPYYSTTSDDPQRFIDMVERIKSGMGATITTASSQAENLNESPVPVTLITEEMIRNSGARNLQEVLVAYVPGMFGIDNNDDINIAMRSIYSSGQEKMLFMLNGHRLNSYSTNISSPDFSLSMEKIKQIEVLRGPASSLYGGVALTAVVNIITKQGADQDGLKVKAGIGSYGQLRGDIVFGKRYFDLDVLVWGSYYKSRGEKKYVPASETGTGLTDGDIIIGGIGKSPSFDFGVKLGWNGFSFMYDSHFSQVISPYSISYTFSPYTYDNYATYQGLHPGTATRSHHVNLSYGRKFGNLFLNATATYDDNSMVHYNVVTEKPIGYLSKILGTPQTLDSLLSNSGGVYRYHDGQEKNYGIQVNGDYSYSLSKNHHGLVSFGGHFNLFDLRDSRYLLGVEYKVPLIDSEDVPVIAKGKEQSFDAYVQLKHTWKNLIFNAGLRYDYKKKYNDDKIHEFSPRLALIFIQPKWNIKLSYSRSFVDAPYFYRKTNIVISQTGDNLKSETMNSLQFTFQTTPAAGLMLELNGFYNRADNLIYPRGFIHTNAGTGKSIGLELMGEYKTSRFRANLAFEALKILDAEYFGREVKRMYNVPDISASLVLTWQATKALNLHTHIGASGNQTSYKVDLMTQQLSEEDLEGRILVDIGGEYRIGPVEFGVNVHNLFNKQYRQGGLSTGLIPQKGRWIIADVAVKF